MTGQRLPNSNLRIIAIITENANKNFNCTKIGVIKMYIFFYFKNTIKIIVVIMKWLRVGG